MCDFLFVTNIDFGNWAAGVVSSGESEPRAVPSCSDTRREPTALAVGGTQPRSLTVIVAVSLSVVPLLFVTVTSTVTVVSPFTSFGGVYVTVS